jgi:hypothetical protein
MLERAVLLSIITAALAASVVIATGIALVLFELG